MLTYSDLTQLRGRISGSFNKDDPKATLFIKLNQLITTLKPNPEQTSLTKAALPLAFKLTLVTADLLNDSARENTEKENRVQELTTCIEAINTLIEKPAQPHIQAQLKKIANYSLLEKPRQDSGALNFFARRVDGLINGVNQTREMIFGTPLMRSRLAIHHFIGPELKRFVLTAQLPTHSIDLGSENKQNKEADVNSKIKALPLIVNLDKKSKECQTDVKALLAALDNFATQVQQANQSTISAAAENALLVSQAMVINLLKGEVNGEYHWVSFQRVVNLTKCLNKAASVVQHPGNPQDVRELEDLIEQSDYQRAVRDKERTAYAGIHVVAASLILGLAIMETIKTFGINLIIHGLVAHGWPLSAEGASVGVGIGQFYLYADSHREQTIFSEKMEDLCKVARLQQRSATEETADENTIQDMDVKSLIDALNASFKKLKESTEKKQDIFAIQAQEVLRSANDLKRDLVYRFSKAKKEKTIARLQELKICIEAAQSVVENPGDKEAVNHLNKLANKANYEIYRFDAGKIFRGALLLLACIPIFFVTLYGTVMTAGLTAGTLLSPFMVMVAAITNIVAAFQREKTELTDQLQTLGHFALIGGNAVASKADGVFNSSPLDKQATDTSLMENSI